MTLLEKMLTANIPVNWTTVKVGWDGPGKFPRLVSIQDAVSFAVECIKNDPEQDVEVLKIAGASDNEESMIDNSIRRLAARENVDVAIESRKWRVILLKELLENLETDPMYGLLKLTEFWSMFDYPSDSPHVVQGRTNNITPQEYYTDANFQMALREHKKWIDKEQSLLRK